MSSTLSPTPTAPVAERHVGSWTDPVAQAFWLLRLGFTIAPIAFGLDKFFNVLVDWPQYLAPVIARNSPWSAQGTMYVVGVIEIVAGLVVLLRPRFGAYLVAAWLAGIIFNLLLIPGYYDVALRDFGLLLAALTLARLATLFPNSLARSHTRS